MNKDQIEKLVKQCMVEVLEAPQEQWKDTFGNKMPGEFTVETSQPEPYDAETDTFAPGPRDRTEPAKNKYAEGEGWYVARVFSPYGMEKWCVVQGYTSRYLDDTGKWNKPMYAKVFSSREEAIQFGKIHLGGEPLQENIRNLIKECICEVLQNDLTNSTGHRYKNAIYGALKQHRFQTEGSSPNDYVTYYVYNFATINVEVNIAENVVKLDVFFDSERMAQNNKIEEYPIPSEYDNEFSKKIVQRALAIQKHLDDNSAIFAGSDEVEEEGFDPQSNAGPNPASTEGTQGNPYEKWNNEMRKMEEEHDQHGRYAQEAGAGDFDPRTFGVNP